MLALSACDRSEDINAASDEHQSSADKTSADKTSSVEKNATIQTDIIPASEQRVGNAALGRQALLSEPIVSCGIPISALESLNADTNSQFKLAERTGEAASLPYNVNLVEDENGVKVAASNCLSCHGAPLFGELVIGLGNEFLDFTQNPSIAVEQSGALVSGEAEVLAWEKFADRIATIAPYMQMRTAGVNPANNLTFALMAHLDPTTMQWQADPITALPSEQAPPVSVPPWWRMSKKHAMFWMGEGRGDHASIMMTAAILCADSLDDVEKLDAIAPDIRTFIESIEAPKYPFAIDDALAAQGREVFENTCSQCHGQYGDEPTYPNRIVSIDVVKTDSSLIDYAFGEGQTYVDWFNKSPFGKRAKAQPSKGYVAPPLDGIWATGPFLHNGSVPTIAGVLKSKTRPMLWHHAAPGDTSKKNFNQSELGWNYTVLPSDSAALSATEAATLTAAQLEETPKDVEPQWIYDTREAGYSNSGHTFGDGLSDAERLSVIEYLKTL